MFSLLKDVAFDRKLRSYWEIFTTSSNFIDVVLLGT